MSLDIAVAWFFAWLGAALALWVISAAPSIIGPVFPRVYARARSWVRFCGVRVMRRVGVR